MRVAAHVRLQEYATHALTTTQKWDIGVKQAAVCDSLLETTNGRGPDGTAVVSASAPACSCRRRPWSPTLRGAAAAPQGSDHSAMVCYNDVRTACATHLKDTALVNRKEVFQLCCAATRSYLRCGRRGRRRG